jgi:serine/threonine protein kinase
MDPERWRLIEEIFQEAAELAPAVRGPYLREACRDQALLREVEKLIDSHERAGAFIEGMPSFEHLVSFDSDAVRGRRMGAYELIREIGQGGMGTVYLAARADEEFSKEVAIKLVKEGVDQESIVRRFRIERQILAALDHPNIARAARRRHNSGRLTLFRHGVHRRGADRIVL